MCPTCHEVPKLAGRGYCAACLKVYQKAYNALWKARLKRKLKPHPEPAMPDPRHELMADWDLEPYGRHTLGLKDTLQPSTGELAAYCGWGIDRWATHSYTAHRFAGSNDWSHAYMIGHQAVRRWWPFCTGTGWEMGPDLSEYVDGSYTSNNKRGHRGGRRPSRGRLFL